MKYLTLCLCAALSVASLHSTHAAENENGAERARERGQGQGQRGERGGRNDMMRNMMRGFGRNMLRGDSDEFLRQSKSDDIKDHESAALQIMQDDAEERLADIKEDIFEDNQSVREAYEAAVLAQMAFLDGLNNNAEIKALSEEREQFLTSMRAGDWGAIRDKMGRMREVSTQIQTLIKGDEQLQALKNERIAKASAFTQALAKALEANQDYQAALEDSKRINKIQDLIREEQMSQWQNRARTDQGRRQGRDDEAEKPAQDVKDF